MLPKHALMYDIKIGNKNTGCIRFVLFDFHLQFWLPYDGLKDTLTHDNFGLKKIQIFCLIIFQDGNDVHVLRLFTKLT